MIRDFEFFHGAAIARLIHSSYPISIKPYSSQSNAGYTVNGRVGLYLKHSSKRLTPWRFSFLAEHKKEINDMTEIYSKVIIGLICNKDGVVGLDSRELAELIAITHDNTEWISVGRRAREKYFVKGSDGKLRYKIGERDFLEKVTKP